MVKSTVSCVREILNFTSIERTDRFDKKTFDPEKFLEKLSISSPKMESLLIKISKLDKADIIKHGKLFKHYIFSDLKQGYGAKIIASGFVAAGYTSVIKGKGGRVTLDKTVLESKDESKFAVLSSTSIYNSVSTPKTTKEILTAFNKRPDNVNGKDIRFIILDSGFKEGVDLFDVKYCHIFEDQQNLGDLTQALGRGTRFCGQSGLRYINGWDLQVFHYKSFVPKSNLFGKVVENTFKTKKSVLKKIQEQDENTRKKIIMEKLILDNIKENAVDKELNKNINNISGSFLSKYSTEIIIGGATLAAVVGGGLVLNKNKNKNK